jgi:diguanylate cyclase
MAQMKFLFGRPSAELPEMDVRLLSEKVNDLQSRCAALVRSISITFNLLKSFALDVEEIRSDRFKEEIERLHDRFHEQDNPKRCELYLEQKKESIASFIQHQHCYIMDREKELCDIIDLLTRAMAHLNVENRDFYQRINQQGEKIIQLSALDDIKRIKYALKAEVEQMWEIVDLKQEQEKLRIRVLADQVHSLKDELEKTKSKAMIDGLTGAYNRQALDEYLSERIERGHAGKNDLSVMMIDIDDFKGINDRFGHVIGDRVLTALVRKCRECIRTDDFLARYGGEEFTIVMEGMNFKNALRKARQICDFIASARYATSENQIGDYLSITISIGVARYKKGDCASDIFARADAALYEAKHKGKNRVVGRKT